MSDPGASERLRYRNAQGIMVEDPEGQWVHVGDLGAMEWALDELLAAPALDIEAAALIAPAPDRAALWEKWTGGERLAYGCGFRDGRAEAAPDPDLIAAVEAVLYEYWTVGPDCDGMLIVMEQLKAARAAHKSRSAPASREAGLGALAAMLDDELRRVQAGYATPETISRARETYARLAASPVTEEPT